MDIYMYINVDIYTYIYTHMKAKYNIVLHYEHIPGLEMQFNAKCLL